MPKNRIEPGLQDNGETLSESESRRENENTERGTDRDKISTLDDLLTDWERQYFKVKLIKGQVKVTCLFDLEIGEYNQVVENCAVECEQRIKHRHEESVDKLRENGVQVVPSAPSGKKLQDMIDITPENINNIYDVVILGSGPAGLTAGLFASRSGLNTLVLGSSTGLLSETKHLDNFPSFIGGTADTTNAASSSASSSHNKASDDLTDRREKARKAALARLEKQQQSSVSIEQTDK